MADATQTPLTVPAPARMVAHFWMIIGVILVAFPIISLYLPGLMK